MAQAEVKAQRERYADAGEDLVAALWHLSVGYGCWCPNGLPKHTHSPNCKDAQAAIAKTRSASLECPLCDQPSSAGTVHQECADREQATADQE